MSAFREGDRVKLIDDHKELRKRGYSTWLNTPWVDKYGPLGTVLEDREDVQTYVRVHWDNFNYNLGESPHNCHTVEEDLIRLDVDPEQLEEDVQAAIDSILRGTP